MENSVGILIPSFLVFGIMVGWPTVIASPMTVGARVSADPFVLSCHEIGVDASAAWFSGRFGPVNVKDAQVYLGEGEYAAGTILFADDPERRAEITWLDSVNKRSPTLIRIQIDKGGRTRWRTPQGLTTGLGLAAVERLNRRPFRLSGFDWDYGGTTMSWSGGVLARAETATCGVWARFWYDSDGLSPEQIRLALQVSGSREFSSGHPGMQARVPWVHDVGLHWR